MSAAPPAPAPAPAAGAPGATAPLAPAGSPRGGSRVGADFVAALAAAAPRAGEASPPDGAHPPASPPLAAAAREPAALLSGLLWRSGERDASAAPAPGDAAAPPLATQQPAAPQIPAPQIPAPQAAVPQAAVQQAAALRPAPPRAERIDADRPDWPLPSPAPPAPDERALRAAPAAPDAVARPAAGEPAAAPVLFDGLVSATPVVETHLPPARWPQALQRLAEAAETARPALVAAATSEAAPRPVAQVLRLTLDPERLGAVSVTLRLRGGALEARLGIERPETVALVESRRGELVEAFRRAGYEIGEIVLTPAQEGRLRPGPETGSAAHDPARESSDDRARRDGDRSGSRGDDAPRRDGGSDQPRREPRRRDAGAVFGAGSA
jgi:hypothetical protein